MGRIASYIKRLPPAILQLLTLAAILSVAAWLRLQTVNWDQGHNLHPDERFLAMVSSAMGIPENITEYLDQSRSPMNPANINFRFYVYGVWPLVITKALGSILDLDSYSPITFLGRILSALSDLSTVIAVYLIALFLGTLSGLLRSRTIALLSALIYSVSVLPIQLSHFYATDSFCNAFAIWSFYFLLRNLKSASLGSSVFWIIAAAIMFAMAIASKISAVFMAPLLGAIILLSALFSNPQKSKWPILAGSCTLFALVSYFGIRIFNPYYFEHSSLLNPTPSALFMKNIAELQSYAQPDNTFPPNIQWMSKTKILFPLQNIIFAGLGLPIALLALAGMIISLNFLLKSIRYRLVISWRSVKPEDLVLLCISGWVVIYFIYQGLQWAHSIRYFIFLYPFLAIFAALASEKILQRLALRQDAQNKNMLTVVFFVLLFIWPYMFTAIYEEKHSRVAASEWIWQNLPDRSTIAHEHWDDALPLQIAGMNHKRFSSIELGIFPPDASGKWNELHQLLEQADYYILSSNRAWGTMPAVPEIFPETAKFYEDLFADKYSGYRLLRAFSSYPRICVPFMPQSCIEFPDLWLEEAFSVYDHPKVMIFENTAKKLSREATDKQ